MEPQVQRVQAGEARHEAGHAAASYAVTVEGLDRAFSCRAGDALLTAMLARGLRDIPVGCRGGGCGVCKVEVLGGRYAALKMSVDHVTAEDRLQHRVLACRIVPHSDLTVRVIGQMANTVRRLVDSASQAERSGGRSGLPNQS
ncbi:2Fe-2S iron-sulfur cluster binding domain-containing protein [Methyloversatilis universalis]|uniref:2Fe-2S iron-sulfur cluster binding domain-containing protein n=1 Tax=Methyloversatilis universalis TaxID=378211 RepID=UPI00037BA4CB|nr:2Fe-2S iron-sulfur cluster binding domain-containing protein [Methyloversatilis universalis]